MPRSIYDIKGRPDADLWMSACDKEITKLLEMGTFEIVNTEDIPAGNKVMDMCVSFKIKQDSQGNVTEYRARFNATLYQFDIKARFSMLHVQIKFTSIFRASIGSLKVRPSSV